VGAQKKEKKSKYFTLVAIPDNTDRVRRWRLSRKFVLLNVYAAAGVALVALGLALHYFSIVEKAGFYHSLRSENLELSTKLRAVEAKIEGISASLERIEQFDAKLRAVTNLNDPERNLAIGPVAGEQTGEWDVPPGLELAQPLDLVGFDAQLAVEARVLERRGGLAGHRAQQRHVLA